MSLFVLFTKYHYGDQVRSDEMGWTYRMPKDENVFLQMYLSGMKVL
jgi:hypothetical protein